MARLTDSAYESIADIYVNQCGENATRAYERWMILNGREMDTKYDSFRTTAAKVIQNPKCQEYIEKFREENKATYKNLRDINIAILQDIALDPCTGKRDRIAALKELNSMCGYNSTNVNLNADANIVVDLDL